MTNEQVDAKVLACVRGGVDTAQTIQSALFPIAKGNDEAYANMRTIDKSLQRLRRAKKIVYVNRAWSAVKT